MSKPITYGSVCSGIEAATQAWHHLGWEPSFFSEIENFPRAVLAHHYPEVPLHGDFTTIEKDEYRPIDLLVGGTPCQSFSVAGLRKGLEDDRGNLCLEFIRLAQRLQPKWLLWENVPGALSSNKGRDFGTFLGALAEIGYGFAYRVLDAQYCRTRQFPRAVPQRRRRLFVVGCIGDWRSAASVLFEPESFCGNPPPSRKAGQGTPGYSASSIGGYSESESAGTLRSAGGDLGGGSENLIAIPHSTASVARELSCRVEGVDTYNASVTGDVSHTIRGIGNDDSKGAVLTKSYSIQGGGATSQNSQGSGINEDVSFTLNNVDKHAVCYSLDSDSSWKKSDNPHSGCPKTDVSRCIDATSQDPSKNQGGVAVCFQPRSADGTPRVVKGDIAPTLDTMSGGQREPVIAFTRNDDGGDATEEICPTLRSGGGTGGVPEAAVCFEPGVTKREGGDSRVTKEVCSTLRSNMGDNQPAVAYGCDIPEAAGFLPGQGSKAEGVGYEEGVGPTLRAGCDNYGVLRCPEVRRLTPTECERLQGFPDGFTKIPYRGKDAQNCPAGPRYKALGNSMAVNVMQWIGERIQEVENG